MKNILISGVIIVGILMYCGCGKSEPEQKSRETKQSTETKNETVKINKVKDVWYNIYKECEENLGTDDIGVSLIATKWRKIGYVHTQIVNDKYENQPSVQKKDYVEIITPYENWSYQVIALSHKNNEPAFFIREEWHSLANKPLVNETRIQNGRAEWTDQNMVAHSIEIPQAREVIPPIAIKQNDKDGIMGWCLSNLLLRRIAYLLSLEKEATVDVPVFLMTENAVLQIRVKCFYEEKLKLENGREISVYRCGAGKISPDRNSWNPKEIFWVNNDREIVRFYNGEKLAMDLTTNEEAKKNLPQLGKWINNEVAIINSLWSLCTAEAIWYQSDPDGDGIKDFWTYDVSCLYRMKNATGNTTKFIDMALANADTKPADSKIFADKIEAWDSIKPEPKSGYFFQAMTTDETDAVYNQNESNGIKATNKWKWAFVAYPADYDKTGTMTFIINQAAIIYKKDLKGISVNHFPKNPEKDGWEKVER